MRVIMVLRVLSSDGRPELGRAESERPSKSTEKARIAPHAMVALEGSLYSFTQTALLAGIHGAGARSKDCVESVSQRRFLHSSHRTARRAIPDRLLQVARTHWGIETGLHYRRMRRCVRIGAA